MHTYILIYSPKRFQISLHPYVTIQVLSKDKTADLALVAHCLDGTTDSKPHNRLHMGSFFFFIRVNDTHKAQANGHSDKGGVNPPIHDIFK